MLGAMTDIPAENYAQRWAGDPRPPVPLVGEEKEILTAFLEAPPPDAATTPRLVDEDVGQPCEGGQVSLDPPRELV
jgi:hypothetical protein